MCRFTVFTFLCGATKLKIAEPCSQTVTNYHGLRYCRLDPYAHVNDGIPRDYAPPTYGPGVCANETCRLVFALITPDDAKKNKHRDMMEDDSPFDMSPDACKEREDRWFRECLTTEQQLDAMGMAFPVAFAEMSLYARAWVYDDQVSDAQWVEQFGVDVAQANVEDAEWRELNPRYMSAKALHLLTSQVVLPASVTDTNGDGDAVAAAGSLAKTKTKTKKTKGKGKPRTTTPLKPLYGPFRCASHTCLPAVGTCRTCGHHHGEEFRKKPHRHVYVPLRQAAKDLSDYAGIEMHENSVLAPMLLVTQGMVHGNDADRKMAAFAHGMLSSVEEDQYLQSVISEFDMDVTDIDPERLTNGACNEQVAWSSAPGCTAANTSGYQSGADDVVFKLELAGDADFSEFMELDI